MSIAKIRGLSLMVLVSLALAVMAQTPSAPGTGTVTGHVTCSDTQRPARFAQVMLFGVPASVTAAPTPGDGSDPQQLALMAVTGINGTNMVQTQTEVDGSFTVNDVTPGDYYVFASVPGYEQPRNLVQAAFEAGADPHKPLPGVPMVHVTADRTAQADISLDRGAAISGRVLWEDGSPVTRAMVTVVAVKDEKALPPQFSMVVMSSVGGGGGLTGITDDLGRYRIAGLAPGDYFVKTMLQTRAQFSMKQGKMNFSRMIGEKPLEVYAPAAFHRAEAKALTLTAGQDFEGEDVAINLTGLHSISGRITSAEDHHGINSGIVTVTDTQDKDFSRTTTVDDDGNFTVSFVPPGAYRLTVSGGGDTVPSSKGAKGVLSFSSGDTVRSYEEGRLQVMVADEDVTGQNVELTASKTVRQGADLGGILGGLVAPPPAPAEH